MKILVILASGIGNSILFSPVISALKKNHPHSQIDIFAYNYVFAEPFRGSDLVDRIYYFEGFKTILKLKKQKYDVSITAFPSNKWQFNLFAFLVDAKERLTHSYEIGRIKTLSFLQNKKIPADEKLHDVEQNLNLLKMLNLPILGDKMVFFKILEENELFAQDFIKKNHLNGKYLIGIHPGSGNIEYKIAPLEKFSEIVRREINTNSAILLFGSKDERKIKEELKSILEKNNKNPIYTIETSLKNTASLIKKCDIFISNDTGLMHIASTSKNTKIIALFNGTNLIRTRPYAKNAELVILSENKLRYPFWNTSAKKR